MRIRLKNFSFHRFVYLYQPAQPSVGRPSLCKTTRPWLVFFWEVKARGDFIGYNNVIPPDWFCRPLISHQRNPLIHLISSSDVCVVGIRLKNFSFYRFVYLYQPDPTFGRQALLMQTPHPGLVFFRRRGKHGEILLVIIMSFLRNWFRRPLISQSVKSA